MRVKDNVRKMVWVKARIRIRPRSRAEIMLGLRLTDKVKGRVGKIVKELLLSFISDDIKG